MSETMSTLLIKIGQLGAELERIIAERDQTKAELERCRGERNAEHVKTNRALSDLAAARERLGEVERELAARDKLLLEEHTLHVAALAKLAAAEKDAAEWKESSRAWQEQASVVHLERDRLECASLRSALTNAEKERDEFAEKVGELAFIRHNLTEERDALAAQLAEARELLGEALPWVIRLLNHADPDCPICGGHATPESSGHRKSCTVRRMSAFLAPPSDRGAEGDRS